MMKILPVLLLSAAGALASCQRTETAADTPATTDAAATTDTLAAGNAPAASAAAQTPEAARAAVGRYLQTEPNRALYQLDSASVVEADAQYQVLVPRTDWAGRMPNKAAFNVDKRTGEVSVQPVK